MGSQLCRPLLRYGPNSTRSSLPRSVGPPSAKIQVERQKEIRIRPTRQAFAVSYDAYIYCDGNSREGQNVCGLAAVVRFPRTDEYRFTSRRLENTCLTHAEAEYRAVDYALKYAKSIFDHYPRVLVLCDLLPIVKQLKGEQNVKKESLLKLRQEVYGWNNHFMDIHFQWVSRKNNKLANEYARKASCDNWATWDHVKN